jgi:hypothetical protein
MRLLQVLLQLIRAKRLRVLGVGMALTAFDGTKFQANFEMDSLVVTVQVGGTSERLHVFSVDVTLASFDGTI